MKSSDLKSSDLKSSDLKSSEVEEQAFVVSLSREEVLTILAMLKLGAIPNLGDDPVPDLTPEQRAYGLIVAERGLRARGLASIGEDGQIRFPNQLLNAIGTCALASRSFFITQMVAHENRTSQFMVHQNGHGSTIHTPIDGTVHQFAWNQNRESVVNQIQSTCRFPTNHKADLEELNDRSPTPGTSELATPDPPEADLAGLSLSIKADVLKRATDLARECATTKAAAELIAQGVSDKDADRLVAFLSAPHVVTVIQSVTPQDSDQSGNRPDESVAVAIQSTTFLHSETQLITAVEPEPSSPDVGPHVSSPYQLTSATPDQVTRLIDSIVS